MQSRALLLNAANPNESQTTSTSDPFDFVNQNNKLVSLEMRILTEFRLYNFVVRFDLLLGLFGIIAAIVFQISIVEALTEFLTSVVLMFACCIAISAKRNMNSRRQASTVTLFLISTILGFAVIICHIVVNYTGLRGPEDNNGGLTNKTKYIIFAVTLSLQLITGLYLTLRARDLSRMMTEKDAVFDQIMMKRIASIASAQDISAFI